MMFLAASVMELKLVVHISVSLSSGTIQVFQNWLLEKTCGWWYHSGGQYEFDPDVLGFNNLFQCHSKIPDCKKMAILLCHYQVMFLYLLCWSLIGNSSALELWHSNPLEQCLVY